MKLKYSIKFRIEQRKDGNGNIITENAPILVDFTFNGKRFKSSIGYLINSKQWDNVK